MTSDQCVRRIPPHSARHRYKFLIAGKGRPVSAESWTPLHTVRYRYASNFFFDFIYIPEHVGMHQWCPASVTEKSWTPLHARRSVAILINLLTVFPLALFMLSLLFRCGTLSRQFTRLL